MERKMREENFTLVELLVIVGVIAVMVGLLLPALAKVKEKGRQTQCANNLKQVACATQFYGDDYNGYVPGEPLYQNDGSAVMMALCPYFNICRANGEQLPYNGDLTLVENAKVFRCPSERSDYYYKQYGWNVYVRMGYACNLTRINHPSSVFLWMDACWHSLGYNAFAQADSSNFVRGGARHNFGSNIAWADCHASWEAIKFPADIKGSWFYQP